MPKSLRRDATKSAVRFSSKAVAGWAWIYCRQAARSAWKSAMRLTIGMARSSVSGLPSMLAEGATAVQPSG